MERVANDELSPGFNIVEAVARGPSRNLRAAAVCFFLLGLATETVLDADSFQMLAETLSHTSDAARSSQNTRRNSCDNFDTGLSRTHKETTDGVARATLPHRPPTHTVPKNACGAILTAVSSGGG